MQIIKFLDTTIRQWLLALLFIKHQDEVITQHYMEIGSQLPVKKRDSSSLPTMKKCLLPSKTNKQTKKPKFHLNSRNLILDLYSNVLRKLQGRAILIIILIHSDSFNPICWRYYRSEIQACVPATFLQDGRLWGFLFRAIPGGKLLCMAPCLKRPSDRMEALPEACVPLLSCCVGHVLQIRLRPTARKTKGCGYQVFC